MESSAGTPNDQSPAGAPVQMGLPFDDFGPEEFELLPVEDEAEAADGEPGRPGSRWSAVGAALRSWGGRLWPRLAWLGLAAILALGSAGLVAAASRPPATGGRDELTYAADKALTDRLDSALGELQILDGDLVALGDQAREVLSFTTQVNQPGLEVAYRTGADTVTRIEQRSTDLGSQLECDPWTPARTAQLELTYSSSLVERWHQVCLAVEGVPPLSQNWSALVDGSQLAMSVANAIARHDSLAAEALQQATQGLYPDALASLAEAHDSLAGAQQVADSFTAAGRDVSTLNQWLDRINGMDIALRALWQAMIDSNGRITDQVTAALRAVADAKALLPDSNAILSVVTYELAGDLVSEAITIELAKADLSAALAALTGTVATQ
jgi:hypothetical protein